MPITVRYPNGFAITYARATTLTSRAAEGWELYTDDPKSGGKVVAVIQASAGAIIEWSSPTKLENAHAVQSAASALAYVVEHLRDYGRPQWQALAKLKHQLTQFNGREGRWK